MKQIPILAILAVCFAGCTLEFDKTRLENNNQRSTLEGPKLIKRISVTDCICDPEEWSEEECCRFQEFPGEWYGCYVTPDGGYMSFHPDSTYAAVEEIYNINCGDYEYQDGGYNIANYRWDEREQLLNMNFFGSYNFSYDVTRDGTMLYLNLYEEDFLGGYFEMEIALSDLDQCPPELGVCYFGKKCKGEVMLDCASEYVCNYALAMTGYEGSWESQGECSDAPEQSLQKSRMNAVPRMGFTPVQDPHRILDLLTIPRVERID